MNRLSGNYWLKKMAVYTVGVPLMKKFKRSSKQVERVQDVLLQKIVNKNRDTLFGKEHEFNSIDNYEQFINNVPIRTYEGHRPYIEKMISGESDVLIEGKPFFYNTTSGTTDKAKFIPVCKESYKTYGKITKLWLYTVLKDNPSIFNGSSFSAVAPAVDGTVEDGTPFGSISGVGYRKIPSILKKTYSVPYPIICIRDYQKKYYGLTLGALARDITYMICPSPSNLIQINKTIINNFDDLVKDIRFGTIREDVLNEVPEDDRNEVIQFFKTPNPQRADELIKLKKKYGEKITFKHYWKNLACINLWKLGNFKRLLPTIESFIGSKTSMRAFGYQASEARVGVVLDNCNDTSLLSPQHYFYEFIKVEDKNLSNPPVYRAHQLIDNQRYYIIISNNSGLYRYDINDIVEVRGFYNQIPRIVFIQKGEGITSITGEKLSEEQVVIAMNRIKSEMSINHYMMICDEKEMQYKLFVEFDDCVLKTDKKDVVSSLDKVLREINPEYEIKRGSNRLKKPVMIEVKKDFYQLFKENLIKKGYAKEGQFKDTFLSRNRKHLEICEKVQSS